MLVVLVRDPSPCDSIYDESRHPGGIDGISRECGAMFLRIEAYAAMGVPEMYGGPNQMSASLRIRGRAVLALSCDGDQTRSLLPRGLPRGRFEAGRGSVWVLMQCVCGMYRAETDA